VQIHGEEAAILESAVRKVGVVRLATRACILWLEWHRIACPQAAHELLSAPVTKSRAPTNLIRWSPHLSRVLYKQL